MQEIIHDLLIKFVRGDILVSGSFIPLRGESMKATDRILEGQEIRQVNEEEYLSEMARVGFIPVGTTKTIEVYVHTDDTGKVPHFHVRKYSNKAKDFEWEVCIEYLSASYFAHGRYDDKIPSRVNISGRDLNKFFDTKKVDGRTYWQIAVNAWNDNNSDREIPVDTVRPDYSKLF